MSDESLELRIAAYRSFNRSYTKHIGALNEGLLGSGFSLVEARLLFELASGGDSASELCSALGLDPGYLSRILGEFEKAGLVSRARAAGDGRRKRLALEPEGRRRFEELDQLSRQEAARTLGRLGEPEQRSLVEALGRALSLLGEGSSGTPTFVIRESRPGDLGWVLRAHAEIYSREYGYGPDFEALVARILADFASARDPERERCWIADRDGSPVGSVFVVKADETSAKLRLLLIESSARGFGLGKALVEECVRFSRAAGYKKLSLWTNSALAAARSLYARAGFSLVSSAPDPMFADGSLAETWELAL